MTYSLANEPWLKYTLAAVADKGLKPGQWTSSRLLDEVLYVESARCGVAAWRPGRMCALRSSTARDNSGGDAVTAPR